MFWPSQSKNCWHQKLQIWNATCFTIFASTSLVYTGLISGSWSLIKLDTWRLRQTTHSRHCSKHNLSDVWFHVSTVSWSKAFELKRREVWAMSFLRTPTLQRNGSDMAWRSQRNVWLRKLGGLSLDVLEDNSLCSIVWLKMIKMKLQNHNLSEVPVTQNFVKEWFRRDEIARIWVAGEKEWQLSSVDFYLVSQALFDGRGSHDFIWCCSEFFF